jgi:predicted esterase
MSLRRASVLANSGVAILTPCRTAPLCLRLHRAPVFFYLSTRDDRVHPGHARKMAARLEELGYDVSYYEEIEGGHGASVTNQQLAHRLAMSYTHLWTRLSARPSPPHATDVRADR